MSMFLSRMNGSATISVDSNHDNHEILLSISVSGGLFLFLSH